MLHSLVRFVISDFLARHEEFSYYIALFVNSVIQWLVHPPPTKAAQGPPTPRLPCSALGIKSNIQIKI